MGPMPPTGIAAQGTSFIGTGRGTDVRAKRARSKVRGRGGKTASRSLRKGVEEKEQSPVSLPKIEH